MSTGTIGRVGSRAAGGRRARSGAATREGTLGQGRFTPWLFMAPYLVLFALFVAIPVVYGLWISLHNWDQFLAEKPWVGLQNYVDLFTPGSAKAEPFWSAMRATGLFVVLSVPLLVVLPFLVALLLNKKFPGRTFFRAIYFAPYVLGVVVVGLLFRFLLDPTSARSTTSSASSGSPPTRRGRRPSRGCGSRSSG